MNQSEKLMRARCRLMTREPFYGHFAMSIKWIPSQMSWRPEPARTMGVRIVNGGEIQCLYYPPFVDKLTLKELYAVIQHEIEHIVRVHTIRIGHREHDIWNIACDATVNGKKSEPRIGYKEANSAEVVVPFKGSIIWIPDDWPKDGTSEHFYDLLEKRGKNTKRCVVCRRAIGSKPGNSKGGTNGADDQCSGCGQSDDGSYEYGGIGGRLVDDHSVWDQSDVSEDEARQIVKDAVDQVVQKCQGHVPGHLEDAIKNLQKPIVRWRDLLRSYMGRHVGNQRTTFSRRNRRHDRFGVPGISHHAAATVNVIIDTSGSVSKKELEQFFAEIDAISSRAKVMVLQWDHAFQGWGKYRRGDWKNFKIHGRGGTDMAAPVQHLIDKRLIANMQIMLTDGECGWHEPCSFPMITVITAPAGSRDGPGWGHEVRLRINE